jgi:hypothetical protein
MQIKMPSFFQGFKFTVGIGIAILIAIVILRLECQNRKLQKQLNDKDTTQVGIVIHPPSVKDKNADSTKVTGGHVKKDSAGVVHHYPKGTFKVNERLFSLVGRWEIVETFDGRDSMLLKYDVDYLKWKLILKFGDRYDFRKGLSITTDPAGILGDVAVDWGNYSPTKKPRAFGIEAGGGVFFNKPVLAGGLRIKKYTFIYVQGDKSKGFLIMRSF